MTGHAHKKDAPAHLRCAILTISDSRYRAAQNGESIDDGSGNAIRQRLESSSSTAYVIAATELLPDDVETIAGAVTRMAAGGDLDVIITTGGTGLTGRDVTIEAIRPLFRKELDGFGELFRSVSFTQSKKIAMLSRATAGIVKSTLVLCLPGSVNAVTTGIDLVIDELAHIVKHIRE